MPQFVIKTPNNLYAIFSTVVDNFVGYGNLKEIREYMLTRVNCRECQHCLEFIEEAIKKADNDTSIESSDGQPFFGWRNCLEIIRVIHGDQAAKEIEKEILAANLTKE